MRKTLLVTLAIVLTALTGCGTTTPTDNSEILSILERMDERLERIEVTTVSDEVVAEQSTEAKATPTPAPTEQPAETEAAQGQSPAEQPAETEATQEQSPAETEAAQEQAPAEEVSEELQVFVIHKDKRIPVKLMEGKLTSACLSNPTDLGVSGDGSFRDLHFIFSGATISQVAWVNGNTFDYKKEAMVPQTINTLSSYLYFCMDEENDKGSANGIYSFEITTASGKIHSYSIKYYDDTIH